MATYETTVDSAWTADETFDYLADFSNAEHWDPGVLAGERLDAGAGRVTTGSSFRLVVPFAGRRMTLVYRVVFIAHENREVVFEAENAVLHARDRIVIQPAARGGTGCTVTYRADVRTRGVFSLLNPVLGRGFRTVGDRAVKGLVGALADPAGPGAARVHGGTDRPS
ncbi:MAG: SRPBCC family protein [Streptosporangiaceae bacterium]